MAFDYVRLISTTGAAKWEGAPLKLGSQENSWLRR